MKSLRLLLLLGGATLAFAQNPPAVRTVQNSASNIVVGLPNSAIAQGSIMVVYGTDLGPATLAAGTFPLQTTLGGSSIQVTVGGKTQSAIMFYSLATQLAAILPSTTPVGTGTFTVTFNGKTSAPAPITVVQSNFGTYLIQGTSDAVAVFQSNNSIVSATNAVNPGEVVAFWGTGLGPVTFDESNPAVQSDMTNVPIEAYVGGKTATILFRGRNGCCAAADNVYLRIPDGVSGCATPVVFKIGNLVSNTASISVATSGRTCTPTNPGVSQSDLNTWLSKGTFSAGGVTLSRTVITTAPITVGPVTVPGSTTKTDSGGASFYKITIPPGANGLASQFDIATFGSCSVLTFSGSSGTVLPATLQFLDAGASIGVTGPNGPKTLTKTTASGITSYSASFDQTATYLGAGSYTVTGPGGADVGSFTANLTLPQPLVWTNQLSITTVDRTKGVTLNWTGGDPSGYVTIGGTSILTAGSSSATAIATFTCTAKTSDGTFTVPSIVLLALPPSGTQSSGGISIAIPGSLSISGVSLPTTFKASGLDYATASSSVVNGNSVTYQ